MAIGPGQLFGNYRVLRLLGEGGFGEVYLVENQLIQRRAAVKVLHPTLAQDTDLVRRFFNEARAASAIRHPNIIEILDAGETPEGTPYILMEFLEGVSLQRRLSDVGRLALPQVLDIARQAGSALAAAHHVGIVHRDLKPENLFLVPDQEAPGKERVKVLDFGIAKTLHRNAATGVFTTRTGVIMGSPAYMSPEQCKDISDVDLRSDIYSFAIILFQMLAGKLPYAAASGTEMLVMHLTATPPPLGQLVSDIPVHVEAAIMRALARERGDRFADMAAFLEALTNSPADAAVVASRSAALGVPYAGGTGPRQPADWILPVSTTLSRATNEVLAEEPDSPLAAVRRPKRWPLLAAGGIALAGLAGFFLVRSGGHEATPEAAPASASAKTVAPLRQEAPQLRPAVVAVGPDAGVPSAAVTGTPSVPRSEKAAVPPFASMRAHRDARVAPSSRKTVESVKREPQVQVPLPRKPEDVAGF